MDFLELAAKRYSVRKFKEEKVRREDLDKILKAGMLAPTAHNDQPQRILVINSDEALEKLKKCTACHFNAHGPAYLQRQGRLLDAQIRRQKEL